jgi:hypothetical protein
MLKGVAKWHPFAIQFLCAFILLACSDQLPDPPAVRPDRNEAKTLRLSNHLEGALDQDQQWSGLVSAPLFTMRWFDTGKILEIGHPIRCATLVVRQGSDSSPPVRAS